MNTSRTRTGVTAFVTALALLTGCGGGQADPGAADRPEAVQAESSASPTPEDETQSEQTELDGVWSIKLTRDELRAGLEAGGFGDLDKKFFNSEEVPPEGVDLTLTVEDGRFHIDYADGYETFGWHGQADVEGDQVTLTDEAGGGTVDVLRWKVDDGQATFDVVTTDDMVVKGIPARAYLYAYFTPKPLEKMS